MLGGLRATQSAPLEPGTPVQVIGDVHGRLDLLEALLAELDPDLPTVLVGDLVDRGEDSAAVLRLLQQRDDLICLLGNHEAMMIEFLDEPLRGRAWMRNGGLQTLQSFGVTGITEASQGEAASAARDKLYEAMGSDLIDWLRDRPLWRRFGNLLVTHAGANPDLPPEDCPERDFLWGATDFGNRPRGDGLWVAHGHKIVTVPVAQEGRIAVDTGAYATGRLTAAVIDDHKVHFITLKRG